MILLHSRLKTFVSVGSSDFSKPFYSAFSSSSDESPPVKSWTVQTIFSLSFQIFWKNKKTIRNTYRSVSLTLTFMMSSPIYLEDKVHYVNFKLSCKLETWDRIYSFMLIMKIKYPVWDYYNFGREFQTLEFLENPVYTPSVLSLQLHSTAFTEHIFCKYLNWYFGPQSASMISFHWWAVIIFTQQ